MRFYENDEDDDMMKQEEKKMKKMKTVEKSTREKQKDLGTEGVDFIDDIEIEEKAELWVDNGDFYLENKDNHRLDEDDPCELKRAFLYVVSTDFPRKGPPLITNQHSFHG